MLLLHLISTHSSRFKLSNFYLRTVYLAVHAVSRHISHSIYTIQVAVWIWMLTSTRTVLMWSIQFMCFRYSMASMLKGTQLTKVKHVEDQTIHWKQGSILGVGGDRQQTYSVYEYKSSGGEKVPVYIQTGWDAAQTLTIDNQLQYGMNDGLFFLVYHDKSQTPFQHRFVQNFTQKSLYMANALIGARTGGVVDLSWAMGDYLHDFWDDTYVSAVRWTQIVL